MSVGHSVSVPLGSPVAKISDADASVVGYFLNTPDQIEVVGRGTGRSPLRVRLADGSSRFFEVDVVVPESMGGEPEPIVVTSATAAAYAASPAGGASAAVAPDDASTLTLAVGESQSFDVTGAATRIDVATAGVVEVERNQPGEVTLIGRAPGKPT
ncbi:MAG: pilus assembly protein N-terminal domain-containing protein [Deltaproteobacteria bacterium]|nr:pilus assembly protein N-terminal domain-containing protein [Deltaproteobacteria bacterium]